MRARRRCVIRHSEQSSQSDSINRQGLVCRVVCHEILYSHGTYPGGWKVQTKVLAK